MRVLRLRQGRSPEDVGSAADGLPELRQTQLHQTGHGGRIPVEGIGVVRHRFQKPRSSARRSSVGSHSGLLRACIVGIRIFGFAARRRVRAGTCGKFFLFRCRSRRAGPVQNHAPGVELNIMLALRKWLFAGLLVIVPLAITVWVLNWIISLLDQTLLILPESWRPDYLLGYHIPGFGVILALVILLSVGAIASNFVGRKLVGWGDAVLSRIPVVRSIYSSVKQVSDTLFSESGNAFRQAMLIQWPREGVWTVAFVTGVPGGDTANYLKDDYLSLYVPTTPNPTGGYFIMMKRADCIELQMNVDEALKYIVSMGVVVPSTPVHPSQTSATAQVAQTSLPDITNK